MLIGESPSVKADTLIGQITVGQQFYLANKNGYIGVMPWSDADGNYENIAKALQCQNDDFNSCSI